MKKIIILAAIFSTLTATALAMPDPLLEAGKPDPVVAAVSSYATVPDQDAVAAVQEFVQTGAWIREQTGQAKKRLAEGRATREDQRWLDFAQQHDPVKKMSHHLERRLEFYRRAHNWNGENPHDRQYNYTLQPGRDLRRKDDPDRGYTNSYGWNVLHQEVLQVEESMKQAGQTENWKNLSQDIVSRVDRLGQSVSNEELRYYLNEMLWFSAKQTVKELKAQSPVSHLDTSSQEKRSL